MKRLSIRLRLTLWYAASLAAMLLLFGVLIDSLMHERLLSRTDFELDEELHELVLEAELAKGRDQLLEQLRLRFSDHKTFEFQVLDAAGDRLFASHRLRDVVVPVPAALSGAEPSFTSRELPSLRDSRIASQQIPTADGGLIVQAVLPLGRYVEELRDLRRLMLAMGPLVLLVAVAGGYWLAWKSLRPVDQMAHTAAQISAHDLSERLDVVNPHDELGHLAQTFNRLLARLEQAFDDLRQFTADAAHEFRTPLAVIRSSAELALRNPRRPEYYQDCLQGIAEETERLTALSDQLLLLAREDAGLADESPQRVNMTVLVEDLASDLCPLAEERSLTIRCDLRPSVIVDGDAQRLRRVVLNLLDNALKFTPAGGSISLALTRRGDWAVMTVTDTGVGIEPDDLPHLFERFYRVDPSRNRETGGAGLGLAICRAIVTRHGGTLGITSTVGRGTTVQIELPLTQSNYASQADDAGQSLTDRLRHRNNGYRCDIRATLQRHL